jgi:uncharacterized membrane protein
MKFRFFYVLATFLACGALVACAGFPAWLRQYTYPPDFKYITQEQLRSTMWQLARQVRELQLLMQEPTSTNERQRQEVVERLTAMEHTTNQLNTSGRPSNHPVINHNLDALRRDIALARASVERNPPNYFLVGSVTGACVYCHRGNPRETRPQL